MHKALVMEGNFGQRKVVEVAFKEVAIIQDKTMEDLLGNLKEVDVIRMVAMVVAFMKVAFEEVEYVEVVDIIVMVEVVYVIKVEVVDIRVVVVIMVFNILIEEVVMFMVINTKEYQSHPNDSEVPLNILLLVKRLELIYFMVSFPQLKQNVEVVVAFY